MRCVSGLEPDFRLEFEEVPLDDEPEELTDLKVVPGATDRLLLLDKQGRLRLYALAEDGGALVDELQLADVFGEDDCGAVSLAFDPAYVENHYVYVGHCVSATASRITRVTLDEPFEAALATAVRQAIRARKVTASRSQRERMLPGRSNSRGRSRKSNRRYRW